MFECSICQESLMRSDEEVNDLFSKLIVSSRRTNITDFILSMREDPETESDDSDDELNRLHSEDLESHARMEYLKNLSLRRPNPSHLKECIKRFYSKMVAVKCGHCFHYSCIKQWCHTRNTGNQTSCPMCREKFVLKDARVIFGTVTATTGLRQAETDLDKMIADRRPVLLRWRAEAVRKLNAWKSRLPHYKTKFIRVFWVPRTQPLWIQEPVQSILRYSFPFVRFLVFFVKLSIWTNVASYNYEMDYPDDEIEQELLRDGGQFLGFGFAVELCYSFLYCFALDLLYMRVPSLLNS